MLLKGVEDNSEAPTPHSPILKCPRPLLLISELDLEAKQILSILPVEGKVIWNNDNSIKSQT